MKRIQMPPYIGQVCELFDVTVLSDIEGDDDTNPRDVKSVYALGWNSEPDAGIRYGTITGWFHTVEELEDFCRRNIGKFQAAAQEDGPAPDATDWR